MTGIVFAKFTKPAHRGKTIVFSDQALVTMRNGAFYLLCRLGDLRPTHLIESHISAYMMRSSRSSFGLNKIYLAKIMYVACFLTELMRVKRFPIIFSPSDLARTWMEHKTFFKCTGPWSCPTGELLFVIVVTPPSSHFSGLTSPLPCGPCRLTV